MQIFGLHKNIYKLSRYTSQQEFLEPHRVRYEKLVEKWDKFKKEGLTDKVTAKFAEISRATYYRAKKQLQKIRQGYVPPSKRPKRLNKPRWGEKEMQLVLRLRRADPTYGKFKIAIIMKRDFGVNISESTVGRILKHLMIKGLVTKSASAIRIKRKRKFAKSHAQAWIYKDYDTMELGERVQIDHMTVTRHNIRMKHFQAWDRKSKFIHAAICSNATAVAAKKFLLELVQKTPFSIKSIQVDGGSEFMADFENACKELNIPLIVLPPAKPEYNGGTERGNRIFREEFYEQPSFRANSLGEAKYLLAKALDKYNNYRPHFNLDGLTPFEYINTNFLQAQNLSQII